MAYEKTEGVLIERKTAGPTMCEWNDHGYKCPHRGILSPGNLGYGPWYCREHFYKLRGYPDMEEQGLHGNELPLTRAQARAQQIEADEYCRKHGLDTTEKKIEHMRKLLASPKPTPYEHWTHVMKTPGLILQAYEAAKNYLERYDREPGEEG